MPAASPARPPYDLKSTAWILTALRLHTADAHAVAAALQAQYADSPGLFDDDPLVLDLTSLYAAAAVPDFVALIAHLRAVNLLPVGVQGGNEAQMAAARAAGLATAAARETRPEPRAVVEAASAPTAPTAPPTPSPAAAAAAALPVEAPVAGPTAAPTLVIDRPLRSGQRVYARGGDLVVLAAVSFGAEVIADGHIHVYGPLRGRAMAGARGDAAARIFSTQMEPQLISIAGIYRTTETPLAIDVAGKPAQVRLAGEKLIVEPLGA